MNKIITTPEKALSGIKETVCTDGFDLKKKTLTVFTPAYNRAYIIQKCYESMTRQTSNDFLWLIIDDGSTDNTREMALGWIKEAKLDIKYVRQENRGMHGAHNTAHTLITSELTVCCDSDDYLADDAVETIVTLWKEKGSDNYAGIIGHDADTEGRILTKISDELTEASLYDMRYRDGNFGDYKLVYRTELLKKELYPMIPGERYIAVGYKYFLIDKEYKSLITQKILCLVDYQPNSGTNNKIKQYMTSPRGFMVYRIKMMPRMHSFYRRFREAIHYVSSAKIANEKHYIAISPCKFTTICALPFGIILSKRIKKKYKIQYGDKK